jgi:hypothetical protein
MPLRLVAPSAATTVEIESGGEVTPVIDRKVTLGAFDVVVGDVHPVHQCDVVELPQALRLVVASEAPVPLRRAGPHRHVLVTGDTRG